MSSFFKTKEYKFLNKIKDYLLILNTKKNYSIYEEHLAVCKKLASEKYNNVGWREEEGRYNWDSVKRTDFPDTMTSLGDESGMSFYPGKTLYMSEDFTSMALKGDDGRVVHYTKEETASVKHMSIKELRVLHDIKMQYEGIVK